MPQIMLIAVKNRDTIKKHRSKKSVKIKQTKINRLKTQTL